MADQIVTASELASYLQQDVDTATAELAIEVSTGAVQAIAGQRIIEVTDDVVTIDLDPLDCGPYLDLPEWPVTAVTSATVGATAVTDYTVQLTRGRLWRALGWRVTTLPDYRAPSTATVVYTHGRPLTAQSMQFARGVVLDLSKDGYKAASGAIVREQIDDYAVQYAAAAAAVESKLDPFGPLARALRRTYGRPRRSSVLTVGR